MLGLQASEGPRQERPHVKIWATEGGSRKKLSTNNKKNSVSTAEGFFETAAPGTGFEKVTLSVRALPALQPVALKQCRNLERSSWPLESSSFWEVAKGEQE